MGFDQKSLLELLDHSTGDHINTNPTDIIACDSEKNEEEFSLLHTD
jgi:hypothetical protein